WRDPRVEYDPINGRFWITIFDVNDDATTGRRFHVAVSRDDEPDTFDPWDETAQTGDWYVYTGRGGSAAEAHGDAFHLAHPTLIDPDLQFIGVPDHPVISIDKDHDDLRGSLQHILRPRAVSCARRQSLHPAGARRRALDHEWGPAVGGGSRDPAA